MKIVTISCLIVALASARGPGGKGGSSGPTAATEEPSNTEDASDDDESYDYEESYDSDDSDHSDDDSYDSEMEAIVKALIDAGNCEEVSSNSNCGDEAAGYYGTFEYNGNRIVVSSGAPDHDAEYDQTKPNPNSRCERWQYAILPLEPEVAATAGADFNMGTTGWASSGGVLFDHRSAPDGSLAYYYEIDSMDPCLGHSDDRYQYHYHFTPECIGGAADNSSCVQLGYMDDGFPVYGQCGTYSSCWKLTGGEDGDNMSDYFYDQSAYDAGECGLDGCGGRTVDGAYAYYMAAELPYVPICRMGTKGTVCGFTP